MIRKAFPYLLLPLLWTSCYQPERKCADYRTGTFQFKYVVDGVGKEGRFTRDSLYSVEYYDNKVDSATVRWINDCEFVLKDVKNKGSVHFKILHTTDSSYTFEYRNAINDPSKKLIVQRGTAVKTK